MPRCIRRQCTAMHVECTSNARLRLAAGHEAIDRRFTQHRPRFLSTYEMPPLDPVREVSF